MKKDFPDFLAFMLIATEGACLVLNVKLFFCSIGTD